MRNFYIISRIGIIVKHYSKETKNSVCFLIGYTTYYATNLYTKTRETFTYFLLNWKANSLDT